jgi:hypothetical protein
MSREIPRPLPDDYPEYFERYIRFVPETHVMASLQAQEEKTRSLLEGVGEERAGFRYAPDKWTIREVMGHLVDTERIFVVRALHFARGESQPLIGYDENAYAGAGRFDARPLEELLREYAAVRMSTVAFFCGLPPAARGNRGIANGKTFSVASVPYIILGHERHHLRVLAERYLPGLPGLPGR